MAEAEPVIVGRKPTNKQGHFYNSLYGPHPVYIIDMAPYPLFGSSICPNLRVVCISKKTDKSGLNGVQMVTCHVVIHLTVARLRSAIALSKC